MLPPPTHIIQQFRQHLIQLPDHNCKVAAYLPPEYDQGYSGLWYVYLHGAFRNSPAVINQLTGVTSKAPTLFIDVPGFGNSSIPAAADPDSLAAIAGAAIGQVLPNQPFVVIGESMSGLLILNMHRIPPNAKALIGLDPPLSSSKHWILISTLSSVLSQMKDYADRSSGEQQAEAQRRYQFSRNVVDKIFGYEFENFGNGNFKRMGSIYYSKLGNITLPMLFLMGDEPLSPVRNISNHCPCCFDDVDRYIVEQFYGNNIKVEQIDNCGHELSKNQPTELFRRIDAFVAGLG